MTALDQAARSPTGGPRYVQPVLANQQNQNVQQIDVHSEKPLLSAAPVPGALLVD